MIDLTPLEVRKKKGDFRKAMRGYEPQAVDDFIDLVADRLEQLVREHAALTERVRSAETQIADYRERERALTEALVTAQEMREEMRRQMEREVDIKLREAEADAEAVRSEAAQIREREEENIRRLRARQSQFVQSYRSFLERELAEIGVMVKTLDLTTEEPASPPPRKRARRPEPQPELAIEAVPPQASRTREAPAASTIAAAAAIPMAAPPIENVEAEAELVEPVRIEEPDVDDELEHGLFDLDEIFPAQETAEHAPDAQLDLEEIALEELELDDLAPMDHARDDDEDDDDDVPALELIEDDIALDPFGDEDRPATRDQVMLPEDELLLDGEAETPADDDDDDDKDGWVSSLLEGKGD